MSSFRGAVCLLLLGWLSCVSAGERLDALDVAAVRVVFPAAGRISEPLQDVAVRAVFGTDGLLGWVYVTDEIHPIPAYSGKPVSMLVGLAPSAEIVGISILAHEEPILVIGVKDSDLLAFTSQYHGLSASQKVRVGAQSREGYHGVDGITGATITAMVLNESVMLTARRVSAALGLPLSAEELAKRAPMPTQLKSEVETRRALKSDHREEHEEPAWTQLWRERPVRLAVLMTGLLLLVTMLVFQDVLVLHPRLFDRLRVGYLLFTVFFIGFYCLGQLSIVNMLAFGRVLAAGFSWNTLLIEPVVFILWSFVAVTIILWGRGVYCGWLCPFGAAQELLHKLGERLQLPSHEFPPMVHERLWAIKYLILIGLFGLSLDSMSTAARAAEVEPFKTVFSLHFVRDWGFVVYALALLAIAVFNSKFYCKYLCPLGAALSFFTRFRIFDWLRRRQECGSPCQTCAAQCQISAIRPTGEIIENECHYCLECQVTYWDDHRCPPLVEKRKRREKREARAAEVLASDASAASN